jgi:stage IV sporulation protein B
MPAGFTLKTGSVQVIGICEVVASKGVGSPAAEVGLRPGDNILKISGILVKSVEDLNKIVADSRGKTLEIEVERGGQVFQYQIVPREDKATGKYKIGVLVRDFVSGVGTITYIDKETGRFGALGHSVMGEDRKEVEVINGIVYECGIVGISKGVRGRAGELRGMFFNDKTLGTAEKLCNSGIYGEINAHYNYQKGLTVRADSMQAHPGEAYIYSTVDGVSPKRYSVEIVKVDKSNKDNKNYVIKITDEELIRETGGIVQGMSGSPILQDGALVGAITHVFLNDPTRGYGIDIEKMLVE